MTTVACSACARTLVAAPGPCPLCARGALQPIPDPAPAAEAAVPFGVSREDLAGHLRDARAGHVFLCPELRDAALLARRATPLWWPTWWVDATGRGPFEAAVAFDYPVRSSVDTWSGGRWQARIVEETRRRWEARWGTLERRVDNVEVRAVTDAAWFHEHLGPWTFADAAPASPEVLGDRAVLLPDRDRDTVWPEAAVLVRERLAADVLAASGAKAIRDFTLASAPADPHYTLLLRPVWATWYTDAAGARRVLWIDGRSGRVARPLASVGRHWAAAATALFTAAVGFGVLGSVGAVTLFWFPPAWVAVAAALCLAAALLLAAGVPLVGWLLARSREAAAERPTAAAG